MADNTSAPQNFHEDGTGPQNSPPAEKKDVRDITADEAKEELKQAIQGSQDILATASTAFPFTLFPDTITIDRAKLTTTRRNFFSSAEVMSIQIRDILNVETTVGPILGTLTIFSRIPTMDAYKIENFWKEDAMRIKRILQGYVIALHREIDVSSLPGPELAELLNKLGEDAHPDIKPVGGQ